MRVNGGDRMTDKPEVVTSSLSETTNFIIWKAEEPDGELTYHIELGTVTIHFFAEEWEEFLQLVRSVI
jgi:hypothetical protein